MMGQTVERSFLALGTEVRLVVVLPQGPAPERVRAAQAQASAALEQAEGWIRRVESTLSRFRPDSELSQLNASQASSLLVSPLLTTALSAALRMAEWTEGLVNPTLLPELEAAGYRQSLAPGWASSHLNLGDVSAHPGAGSSPPHRVVGWSPGSAPPRDPERRESRWQAIRVDRRFHLVTRPPGVRVELGGTAKGWAADQVVRRLVGQGGRRGRGPAALPRGEAGPPPAVAADLGGDLRVFLPPGAPPWPVTVADPFRPETAMARISLPEGAMATSTTLRRSWEHRGGMAHHIVDPRTGHPADTDLVSVTALAPSALWAEALAKAALILGRQEGVRYLEERGVPAVLVSRTGELLTTTALRRYRHEFHVAPAHDFAAC